MSKKIGRNEKCLCGSGKKNKKCCNKKVIQSNIDNDELKSMFETKSFSHRQRYVIRECFREPLLYYDYNMCLYNSDDCGLMIKPKEVLTYSSYCSTFGMWGRDYEPISIDCEEQRYLMNQDKEGRKSFKKVGMILKKDGLWTFLKDSGWEFTKEGIFGLIGIPHTFSKLGRIGVQLTNENGKEWKWDDENLKVIPVTEELGKIDFGGIHSELSKEKVDELNRVFVESIKEKSFEG